MSDISVSIVNYNAKESLRLCLSSLKNNNLKSELEIIVSDNDSIDGSVQMVEQEFPEVKLIKNGQNIGVAKARNQTLRLATGSYILFLDSDVEILPESIESMFLFLEENAQAGVVGPKVFFPNHRIQHSCNTSAPNLFSLFLNKILFFSNIRYFFYKTMIGSLYLGFRFSKVRKCAWLGGMCLFVRREVVDELEGVDEDYFLYYDDVDFCLRARQFGWDVYYLPDCNVIHHLSKGVGRSFNKNLYPKIYESELAFFHKHYGVLGKKIAGMLIIFGMYLRLLVAMPFFLKERVEAYLEVIKLVSTKT